MNGEDCLCPVRALGHHIKICIYWETNCEDCLCMVRALGCCFLHIRQHGRMTKTFELPFGTTNPAQSSQYPTTKGIPITLINTHSLCSSSANALTLLGYLDMQIQKMGHWRGQHSRSTSGRNSSVMHKTCPAGPWNENSTLSTSRGMHSLKYQMARFTALNLKNNGITVNLHTCNIPPSHITTLLIVTPTNWAIQSGGWLGYIGCTSLSSTPWHLLLMIQGNVKTKHKFLLLSFYVIVIKGGPMVQGDVSVLGWRASRWCPRLPAPDPVVGCLKHPPLWLVIW